MKLGSVSTTLAAVATAALILLASGNAAVADSIDCKNAVAQMDMNQCADQDFQRSDTLLNKAYKDAEKDLDAHGLELLRKAERAWLEFRDAECAYETVGDEGGSIQPMNYSNCLSRLTRLRTKELKSAGAD